MARRYQRPTRKELAGSHLLMLSRLDVTDSGELPLKVRRTIKLCLNSGVEMSKIASMVGRSAEEIESELEKGTDL